MAQLVTRIDQNTASIRQISYFRSLLVMLDVLLFNVVVRTQWLLEIGSDNHSWAFGSSATHKQHDASAIVLICGLQESDGNTHGDTSAALRTLVCSNGPRIALELFQDRGKCVLALLDGQQEARVAAGCEGSGLSRADGLLGPHRLSRESKHILNLFRGVILVAAEDV